ncbi:hypothetical protein F5B20DRAFT_101112 [Whalleya microplaca]|nr:hypothetical protein F5B20DRAFT_101112 [Whalleya microplaca]
MSIASLCTSLSLFPVPLPCPLYCVQGPRLEDRQTVRVGFFGFFSTLLLAFPDYVIHAVCTELAIDRRDASAWPCINGFELSRCISRPVKIRMGVMRRDVILSGSLASYMLDSRADLCFHCSSRALTSEILGSLNVIRPDFIFLLQYTSVEMSTINCQLSAN